MGSTPSKKNNRPKSKLKLKPLKKKKKKTHKNVRIANKSLFRQKRCGQCKVK